MNKKVLIEATVLGLVGQGFTTITAPLAVVVLVLLLRVVAPRYFRPAERVPGSCVVPTQCVGLFLAFWIDPISRPLWLAATMPWMKTRSKTPAFRGWRAIIRYIALTLVGSSVGWMIGKWVGVGYLMAASIHTTLVIHGTVSGEGDV